MLIRADARYIPLKDCCIDAVVTDPPYGLKFMGKEWDHGVPGIAFWLEALRVCKPGATILDPFCGSGSTVIAAQKLGRICIALDLNYQDLAARRIGGPLFASVVNSAWS